MVPDFSLRIQAMIRSLQETILPALPKEQRLALDQANILIGNLRIMADQQDKLFRFYMVELREYAGLVRGLIEGAQGAAATQAAVAGAKRILAAAQPVELLSIPAQPDLTALVKSVKQAAEDLLRAAHEDGSAEFRNLADALVYRQSEKQILRERVWLRGAGFELEPGKLPKLEEILSGDFDKRATAEI